MGSSLPNLIKLFVVASFVMSVFLAQSRSNVVGLVIVVGTALLFKSVFNLNRRTLKSLVKRTVLILVVILTMLMSFDFVAGSITDSRLFNRFIDSRYLGNVYSRFSLWNEYIEEIVGGSAITFIFGYGMGNQSRLIDIAGSPTRRPHNGYLLLLHQVGILGLLLYCWFFFEIARISRVMSLIVLYSGTVAFFEPLVLTGWFEILLVALSSFEFKTQHFENRA